MKTENAKDNRGPKLRGKGKGFFFYIFKFFFWEEKGDKTARYFFFLESTAIQD